MNGAARIEKLHRGHKVEAFRCGRPERDRFLIRHALQAQFANASQTYVAVREDDVIGYCTFVVGQVERAGAPQRIAKGMPRHPIPLLVLARLAAREDWQGRGVGAGLLRDALGRTDQAADIAGVRALAVHAKDDGAAAFYRHFDFEPSPTDPRHLFLLVKDIRAATERPLARTGRSGV
ncbi:acetyltransferase (GNAT) family protein [Roseiarcus fermentans]|uniref:Acetyltransferase (GNAT) family protein n=1 Tax=Roseiarcus fermentans TaxID=1473586 RepID=A0A366F371_9HYPH|nr:GNAT family N-acetyltransferase [Roseiarcus fermentans]RBP09047.1 acetyltransferase (GNAT) family protein [Roseiarcus fermentans]